jgi:mannitol-specific phosphotransferase system IIBC component
VSEFRKEMEEFFGKRITKGVMIIIGLFIVWIIIAAVFSFWPLNSVTKIIQKTTSAESIIANYEWFYDQKAAIDATTRKYAIAEKAGMEEAPGIAMVLESMIAEYNSRSKQITRNLWKASDLPYQIKSEGIE